MSVATALAISLVAGVAVNGLSRFGERESYRQIIHNAARGTLEDREYDTGLDPESILKIIDETHISPSIGGDLMDVGDRDELVMELGRILEAEGNMDQAQSVGFVRDLITNIERQIAAEAGPGFSVILQYVQDIAENTQKQDEQIRALVDELDEGNLSELSKRWNQDLRTLNSRTERKLSGVQEADRDTQHVPLHAEKQEQISTTVGAGRDVLVHGPAGAGKSTLAKALVRDWRQTNQGAAYLLNARDLNTHATLSENLNLSHAPIQVLEAAAEELNHVLLVLDQLDSIHNDPIIHEIKDLLFEAVDIPGLTVVCVARDWELEHGGLLRDIREQLQEIRLGDLPDEVVAKYLTALGIPEAQQSSEITEFMTTPLRLQLLEDILDQVDDEPLTSRELEELTSEIQLWDAYYESLNEREPVNTASSRERATITDCAGALAREAYLSGPGVSISGSDIPEECPGWAIDRLRSRGVIHQHSAREKQVVFSHEELQAYLYARWLVDRGKEMDLIELENEGRLTATDVFDWTVRLLSKRDTDLLISFVRGALAPDTGLDYYPASLVLKSIQASYDDPDNELTQLIWTQLELRENLSAYFFETIEDDLWLQSYLNSPYTRTLAAEERTAISTTLNKGIVDPTEWAREVSDYISLTTITELPLRVSGINARSLRSEIIEPVEEAELSDIPRESVWSLFDHLVEHEEDQFALELGESLFDKFDPASLPRHVFLDDEGQYLLDPHIWEGTGPSFEMLYQRHPQETRHIFENGLEDLQLVAEGRNVSIPLGALCVDNDVSSGYESGPEAFNVQRLPALIELHLSYFFKVVVSKAEEEPRKLPESTVRGYLERGNAFREFGRAVIARAPSQYTDLVPREVTAPETYGPGVNCTTTLSLLSRAFESLNESVMQEVVEIIDSVPCRDGLTQVKRDLEREAGNTVELAEIEDYWKVTHFATIYETAKYHTDYSLLELVIDYVAPEYLGSVPTRDSQRDLPKTLPDGTPAEVVEQCNKWARNPTRQAWLDWERQETPHPLTYVAGDFADRVHDNPAEYLPVLSQVGWEAKILLRRSLRGIVPKIESAQLDPLVDAVELCFEAGNYSPYPREGVEERRTALRCSLDIIRYEHLAETALDEYDERIQNLAEQGLTDPDPGLDLEDDRSFISDPRELAESRVRSLSFLILTRMLESEEVQEVIGSVATDTETAVHCALGLRLALIDDIDDQAETDYLATCLATAGDQEWLVWTAFLSNYSISLPTIERYEDRVRDALAALGRQVTAEPGSLGPTHDLLDTLTTRAIFTFLVSIYTTQTARVDQEALITAYLSHADDRIVGSSVTDCWESDDQFKGWWRFRLESGKTTRPGPHELAAYLEQVSQSAEEFNPLIWSELIEQSISKAVTTRDGWLALIEYLNTHAHNHPQRSAELLRQAVIHRPSSELKYIGNTFGELEQTLLEDDPSARIMKDIMKQIAPENEAVEERLRRLK